MLASLTSLFSFLLSLISLKFALLKLVTSQRNVNKFLQIILPCVKIRNFVQKKIVKLKVSLYIAIYYVKKRLWTVTPFVSFLDFITWNFVKVQQCPANFGNTGEITKKTWKEKSRKISCEPTRIRLISREKLLIIFMGKESGKCCCFALLTSTLISRKKSALFLWKKSWQCCGIVLISFGQVRFHEKIWIFSNFLKKAKVKTCNFAFARKILVKLLVDDDGHGPPFCQQKVTKL